MRRPTRVNDLLAFDLALRAGTIPGKRDEVRPSGAPRLLPRRPGRAQCNALVGFDEAGRGALAGPVAVGCVQIPDVLLDGPERVVSLLVEVDDSKQLTARARERAFASIAACTRWAVGYAPACEIDCLGIVPATQLAARRAYHRLGLPADLTVFDRGLSMGNPVILDPGCSAVCGGERRGSPAEVPRGHTLGSLFQAYGLGAAAPGLTEAHVGRGLPPGVAFTGGDTRSLHVAAASLVAKVTRDHLMLRLDQAFPGYELAKHKGYGTQRHRDLIARRGPSPIHRLTFLGAGDGAESQSC